MALTCGPTTTLIRSRVRRPERNIRNDHNTLSSVGVGIRRGMESLYAVDAIEPVVEQVAVRRVRRPGVGGEYRIHEREVGVLFVHAETGDPDLVCRPSDLEPGALLEHREGFGRLLVGEFLGERVHRLRKHEIEPDTDRKGVGIRPFHDGESLAVGLIAALKRAVQHIGVHERVLDHATPRQLQRRTHRPVRVLPGRG